MFYSDNPPTKAFALVYTTGSYTGRGEMGGGGGIFVSPTPRPPDQANIQILLA